jgi:hypothetical protein
MRKQDYQTIRISRKEFMKLCEKYECHLNFLRKNNKQNHYSIRCALIRDLELSDIENINSNDINTIFNQSFEYISNDQAKLEIVASYIKMRNNAGHNLRKRLRAVKFEQIEKEIRVQELEIDKQIEEFKIQIKTLENAKDRINYSNNMKLKRISNFINN